MEPIHFPIVRVDELQARAIPLIDVREPVEWEEGTIPGAGTVSLSQLRTGDLGEISSFSTEQPVALYCRGGVRSEEAARIVLAHGYQEVYTLDGGYMAWIEHNQKS